MAHLCTTGGLSTPIKCHHEGYPPCSTGKSCNLGASLQTC